MSRDLIINISDRDKEGLIKDPLLQIGTNLSPIVKADSEHIRIFPVIPTNNAALPWMSVDWTGYSIAASIGNPGQKPTGGTFVIGYDGSDTSSLSVNTSISDFETALNGLAGITSDGGVTVTGVAGDYYAVEWNNVGARATEFTHNSKSLTPFGSVVVDAVQIGDASTKEIRIIRLRAQVYATKGVFTPVSEIQGDVTQLVAGTPSISEVQQFKFDRKPLFGTFQITFDGTTTSNMPYNSSASYVEERLGTADYSVTGPDGGPWIVTKRDPGAVALGSMNTDSIIGLKGWEAILKTSTKELFIELTSVNQRSITRTFEIEITDGDGNVETVFQSPIVITKEVMASGIITSLAEEFGVPPSALGVNTYANLNAANAGEALHNVVFYNATIGKYQITTSDS